MRSLHFLGVFELAHARAAKSFCAQNSFLLSSYSSINKYEPVLMYLNFVENTNHYVQYSRWYDRALLNLKLNQHAITNLQSVHHSKETTSKQYTLECPFFNILSIEKRQFRQRPQQSYALATAMS